MSINSARKQANDVANSEATFNSIFYNNARKLPALISSCLVLSLFVVSVLTCLAMTVYVLLTLVCGFFLFNNVSPVFNFALTSLTASAFTVLSHI